MSRGSPSCSSGLLSARRPSCDLSEIVAEERTALVLDRAIDGDHARALLAVAAELALVEHEFLEIAGIGDRPAADDDILVPVIELRLQRRDERFDLFLSHDSLPALAVKWSASSIARSRRVEATRACEAKGGLSST